MPHVAVQPEFATIKCRCQNDLSRFADSSRDVIVVSTSFNPAGESRFGFGDALTEGSTHLLTEAGRILRFGGLLFIYGLPRELASWGEQLSGQHAGGQQWVFKYWIALDIDSSPRDTLLKSTHFGLLMYLKGRSDRKGAPAFHLNTDPVRIPHIRCAACGQNLKDWGGKKHLMNPKGAALSDVWRDLPRRMIRDSVVPKDVLARIGRLTQVKGGRYLHIIQSEPCLVSSADSPVREFASVNVRAGKAVRGSIEPDEVLKADCVSFLEKVAKSHPEGLFDLAFADPPYNLQKLYGNYDDALAEHRYIEWCNQWLDGMARSLKPGGSLFVLNLPRWAIHHAAFLNKKLEFRHWIAWDALSDPRGKIMPAHYALLWYTRPGVEPKFNYVPVDRPPQASSRREPKLQITEAVLPPDAPNYCLRSSCVRKRKARGDDDKVDLSDVWFDIHRIKHKRDRDAHPCQLPERLMERIIRLSTNPGDWVFDPFCGAGTTAVSAAKLGRRFVVTDIDSHYVRITMEKLAAMKENARVTGDLLVPRTSVRRPRAAVLKREVEVFLQGLARELGRVPTEQDLENTDASLLQKIDTIYPNRGAALKRARIALAV